MFCFFVYMFLKPNPASFGQFLQMRSASQGAEPSPVPPEAPETTEELRQLEERAKSEGVSLLDVLNAELPEGSDNQVEELIRKAAAKAAQEKE